MATRKTTPKTSFGSLPANWRPKDEAIAKVVKKYPTVDVDGTVEWFLVQADAKGWMYSNWSSAFVNYVMNGIEKGYGGVKYLTGKAGDPKWQRVIARAREFDFRGPFNHETPTSYGQALETHIENQKRAPVPGAIGQMLRKVTG